MRSALRFAAVLLLISPIFVTAQAPRTPVLVELFTSEGCSTCPPADRLLATLDSSQPVAGADIIVLEEHVDYWDGQGWHDRFSSSLFTNRQILYGSRFKFDSPYTPQMVVDGSYQFVGNDPSKAISAITRAAATSKLTLQIGSPVVEGKRIAGSVATASSSQLPRADLYAALVDTTATTEVGSGENGGKHLDHVSVVRTFQKIGSTKDLAKGPVSFTLNAPIQATPVPRRLIVFAQLPDQGAVIAIAASQIPSLR